jgi:hypothetical protein
LVRRSIGGQCYWLLEDRRNPDASFCPVWLDFAAGRSFRARVELHEPVLETLSNSTVSGITPAPTISYVTRSFTDFVMPERASLQNRKDIRKMHALALAETQITALVESLTYIS